MRRLAIVLVLLSGCSSDDGERPRPQRWVTYHDTAHAYRISLPPSWHVAKESLTPGLTDPREIFAAGSFRATAGNGNCGHVPAGAVRRMGASDVLLTIQERRGSGGFEERPRPFVIGPPAQGDLTLCAERPDVQSRSAGFRDAGRGFHVLAAVGAGAPASTKRDIERALDSLELEPPWRSRRLGLRMQPPSGWTVKTAPRQLAFGSHDFPEPSGEACPLPALDGRLDPRGAFAYLFEYRGLNRTQRMRFPSSTRFSLRERDRRSYECFGDSWLFRWRDKGRPFQAHAYLGHRATARRRRELTAALRSIAPIRSR